MLNALATPARGRPGALLLALLLPACDAPATCGGGAADRWTDGRPGAGFGHAVAAGGEALAGAPWAEGGAVYRLCGDGTALPLADLPGEPGAALGASVASVLGRWAAGAPLAGEGRGALLVDGQRLDGPEDAGLGSRVAWGPWGLLVSARVSVYWDGRPYDLPDAPAQAAVVEETLAVGLPWGTVALLLGERTADREAEGDEAGRALCAADLDGDGHADLAVGAPGSGTVAVYADPVHTDLEPDLRLSAAAGRFGQAVACVDGALAIGAPLEGEGGAVYVLEAPMELAPSASLAGRAERLGDPGTHLGAALHWGAAGLLAGAPGGADTPGEAVRVR